MVCAALFVSFIAPTRALAQTRPEPTASSGGRTVGVSVVFAAPDECPRQDWFWARVAHASGRVRAAGARDAERSYEVGIVKTEAGFRGELREATKPSARTIDASQCPELVEALALMLAISADPEAELEQPGAPPAAQQPARVDVQADAPAQPALEGPEPPSAARRAGTLGTFLLIGAAADPLFGLAVGYDHPLSNTFAARVEARGAVVKLNAETRFAAVAPQLCAWFAPPVAELGVCAGVAVGLLDVEGVEYSGDQQSSVWLAPGLNARARTSPERPLFVELAAGIESGLIGRSYHVKSDNSNFSTPLVSAVVQLALGGVL